jgi:hypothetical protein
MGTSSPQTRTGTLATGDTWQWSARVEGREPEMGTAKLIKDVSQKFKGNVKLYEVYPPMEYKYWQDSERTTKKCSTVVVSAVHTRSGSETYIFPSDKEGNVIDWGELDGSFQGDTDHTKALKNAGYEIV